MYILNDSCKYNHMKKHTKKSRNIREFLLLCYLPAAHAWAGSVAHVAWLIELLLVHTHDRVSGLYSDSGGHSMHSPLYVFSITLSSWHMQDEPL